MTATVHLPGMLAALCGGAKDVVANGATVHELLTDLTRQYPLLRRHLYDDAGSLRGYINIYRNEEDVRYLDGMATAVRDRDIIFVVPSVAGGISYLNHCSPQRLRVTVRLAEKEKTNCFYSASLGESPVSLR